ncbi:putative copper homeostasis (lipo)protein LpqS [Nocardia asiatica]
MDGAYRRCYAIRRYRRRPTVNHISRLRSGRHIATLLLAVLLIAPVIDCALLGEHAHPHPRSPSSAAHVAHLASATLEREVIDLFEDDCGPHLVHCIVKSTLPGAAAGMLLVQLLTSMLAVVVAVPTTLRSASGGVRGPPVAGLPVVAGRDILMRFCIARR